MTEKHIVMKRYILSVILAAAALTVQAEDFVKIVNEPGLVNIDIVIFSDGLKILNTYRIPHSLFP